MVVKRSDEDERVGITKEIQPIVPDVHKDKLFKCLIKDADIVNNYLQQYINPLKDTDYIAPMQIGRWQMIKEHIKAMHKHINEMEEKHYFLP